MWCTPEIKSKSNAIKSVLWKVPGKKAPSSNWALFQPQRQCHAELLAPWLGSKTLTHNNGAICWLAFLWSSHQIFQTAFVKDKNVTVIHLRYQQEDLCGFPPACSLGKKNIRRYAPAISRSKVLRNGLIIKFWNLKKWLESSSVLTDPGGLHCHAGCNTSSEAHFPGKWPLQATSAFGTSKSRHLPHTFGGDFFKKDLGWNVTQLKFK